MVGSGGGIEISVKFKNIHVDIHLIDPFKPKGNSHSCQLDQSIFVLRVIGWYFPFLIKACIKSSSNETI